MSKYQEIDLSRIKTYSVTKRKSKTEISKFAKVSKPTDSISTFRNKLPKYLKAEELNQFVKIMQNARKRNKPIIFMLGAHVIKCGLSPVIIDLMKQGFVSSIALNGAGAIHDFELARWGATSEDVGESIKKGFFGMAKETAELFNRASLLASKEDMGLGEALGRNLLKDKSPYSKYSILAWAYKLNIPVTVHIGFGTDVVHQHPNFDAGSTGKTTFRDFKILAYMVAKLYDGGVVLNIGSAVFLPEVFLKTLSVARNIKKKVDNFYTANFDMIQHYRPNVNVVLRPTQDKGKGFSFTGHHEIIIPLLAWMLKVK
ncbi:MAG: hypothetical protein MUO85_01240 [candidate division Zixibacteria bacterium]|nr:hypothetical protein [candidate division Zixibacteria bacterium]